VLAPALFAASASPVYALPATIIVTLVWIGVTARTIWRASMGLILAGGLLGATLLVSFSLIPLALLCGALIICRVWQESGPRISPVLRRSAAAVLAYGLGLLVVWGAYTLALGHFPLLLLRVAMDMHLASGSGLSYLAGLGLNAWDFALFTGLPICGLAIASAFGKRLPGVSCLATALGGTLLALLLSGTARGEVARVWAFFTPFVVLLGATVFRQLRPSLRWSLLAGQVLLLMAFAGAFTPEATRAVPLPSYAQVAQPPLQAPELPMDATIGDGLRLLGYQAQYRPATRTLALALKWQVLQRLDMPYYFSAALVAPDGHTLPGVVWQPFGTRYPTSCWEPGQTIVDQIELPLGPDAAAGDWWLSLAAFGILADKPLPRLPVSLPDGTVDTQLGLGPLPVGSGE
jgi:hypothetical protein